MQRRNVEGDHAFANLVAEQCNIFQLGGLLLDKAWNFSAAVEAFEITPEESSQPLSSVLAANGYEKELYMAGLFAHALGVPFFLLAHVAGKSVIHIYSVVSDRDAKKLECLRYEALTEDEFIAWWQEKKGTFQVKAYRKDFKQRAKTSYFDNLLEGHGLKWGGNIDGYLAVDGSDAANMVAIIENRFTNKTPLKSYDPNDYYSGYNGGDYNTWLPLIKMKEKLGIPLFLMTYSYRYGERKQVGITQILGQTQEKGLQYAASPKGVPVRPCDNIFHNLTDIKAWFQNQLGRV